MRALMKWCINSDEMKENQILRQNALMHNQLHPYSPLEVPERVIEKYANCPFSFRVSNVIDWYVEPTKEKDIVCNLAPNKQIVFEYDPLLESKLNLSFNGE